jgi:indolepyruvate ferredoxin oxidoreductase beta subunit
MTMNTQRPISLLVCALGGEGGGVLTEWLVNIASQAGYAAQATSIPGVAQRTGATTYYIEVFPVPVAELGGRKPVFSLNPVPGALDAIVSSELLETARQIGNGMASRERTLVLTSTSRALTTQERMQLGDGRAESDELLGIVREFSRAHHAFDMNAVAKEASTVVSAVMLGAIAGSGIFPFTRDDYENVVREGGGASAQASLRGFEKAFALCRARPDVAGSGIEDAAADIVALGRRRLVDYQGPRYAQLYDERLARVRAADTAPFDITRETARWLALWMAFDDIVRVADLKSRASRWQRVKGEVKAADADLLRVWDHFKPGAPEFAALLPPALAQRVMAWDRRRATPWALPLKVGTHSVFGMLALRTLASLKWLRPKGSRYAAEQQMIERWLGAVVEGAKRDARLGMEIAMCGRLIKGYGTTNERGKANLLHVLDHLAPLPDAHAAARAIAEAREAALADDAGKALDAALVRHGAAPRPVKEQPVRFMPRRPRVETTIPERPA